MGGRLQQLIDNAPFIVILLLLMVLVTLGEAAHRCLERWRRKRN